MGCRRSGRSAVPVSPAWAVNPFPLLSVSTVDAGQRGKGKDTFAGVVSPFTQTIAWAPGEKRAGGCGGRLPRPFLGLSVEGILLPQKQAWDRHHRGIAAALQGRAGYGQLGAR